MTDDDVLTQVRESLFPLQMHTPVDEVIARGRSRRRRRRFTAVAAGLTTGVALTLSLTGALSSGGQSSITNASDANDGKSLDIRTAAFTVTTNSDGSVTVWTKQAYFQDPTRLQDALRTAGFPILMKVGVFCRGPNDDGYLDPSGQGRGVQKVMAPSENNDGDVLFTFDPKAMPADTELFIGYLSPAQLAVTHGNPGSVERLVPADTQLVCNDPAPPPNPRFPSQTPRAQVGQSAE